MKSGFIILIILLTLGHTSYNGLLFPKNTFELLTNNSNYSFYQDDLVGDEVGIPLYFLGKSSRKNNIKVVQVGEGADELFYGYEHWLRFMKLNRLIKPITSKRNSSFMFDNHRSNLVSNILFNRTSFSGGALGFNLSEINNLVSGGISNEYSSIHYVDNMWDQYFSNRKELQNGADSIFEKIKFGKIKIRISKKYKLAEAKQAHADLEARKLLGPAILIP